MKSGWGFIDRSGKFIIDPQFRYVYESFSDGLIRICTGENCGFLINPLSSKDQEKSLNISGLRVGEIKSVAAGEIVVGGTDIGSRVMLGDKLCLYNGENMIILRSTFPMMTTTKCTVVSGSSKDLKKGMPVYKYTGGKKKHERDN